MEVLLLGNPPMWGPVRSHLQKCTADLVKPIKDIELFWPEEDLNKLQRGIK